jgi:hypothetical protein
MVSRKQHEHEPSFLTLLSPSPGSDDDDDDQRMSVVFSLLWDVFSRLLQHPRFWRCPTPQMTKVKTCTHRDMHATLPARRGQARALPSPRSTPRETARRKVESREREWLLIFKLLGVDADKRAQDKKKPGAGPPVIAVEARKVPACVVVSLLS